MTVAINAAFPGKLHFLLDSCRYKVIYGGRGGAKSWGVARYLLLQGFQTKERFLCVREFQNSISESVHKLLSDQIDALALDGKEGRPLYIVEKARIYCPATGTEFFFEGIRNNATRIKSYEGITKVWAEEANKITKSSWEILIPTIRAVNSEIIVTFNPELETDDTYQRFVKNHYGIPEKNLAVVKMNWRDNIWFPAVLRMEMESLKAADMDAYLNIWEGECRVVLDGAVYANELRDATKDGRICRVPYEHAVPIDTFWDLGHADQTSIWFGQYVGFQYRIIDFYQNHLRNLDHYLDVLQRRGYIYGTLWLPHDARAQTVGTKRSVEEQCRDKGYRVRIVPKLSLTDSINAARTIFPNCYFDETKCAEGLQCLRHYRYEVSEDGLSRVPVHDQFSHAADAFRYLGVAFREPKREGVGKIYEAGRALAAKFAGYEKHEPLGWMR